MKSCDDVQIYFRPSICICNLGIIKVLWLSSRGHNRLCTTESIKIHLYLDTHRWRKTQKRASEILIKIFLFLDNLTLTFCFKEVLRKVNTTWFLGNIIFVILYFMLVTWYFLCIICEKINIQVILRKSSFCHRCRSGVFIVHFEHISHLFLLFLLLTLNK